MKKFFEKLFKKEDQLNEISERFTLDDLAGCDFFTLNQNVKLETLLKDGHFKYVKIQSTEVDPKAYMKNDERFYKSGLPLEGPVINLLDLQYDEKEQLQIRKSILLDMFVFFEKSLEKNIRGEQINLEKQLRGYLINFEEAKKRIAVQGYIMDLFKTLIFEENHLTQYLNKLHEGIEKTNVLSNLWAFEEYLKIQIFSDVEDLIFRYLYCRESLLVSDLHAYHPMLEELVRFCSRRNFMISLNDKYNFETNHPYSNTLYFTEYDDLFKSEKCFDLVVQLIIEEINPLDAFYDELAYVILNKGILVGVKQKKRFINFLNKNFELNITRLRPSNANRTENAKHRVKELEKLFESI